MKHIVFFLVFVLAQTLGAATYYVSKTGNDSNAGTSTNAAFLTISKAASLMNAGDTCYVLSGTYRETVTPARSGTPSDPITFAAYPGQTAVVSGADVLNLTWSIYNGSIYMAATTNLINQLFVDGYMMNIARWPNAAVDQFYAAPSRSAPTAVTLTNLQDNHLPTNNVKLTGAATNVNLVGAYMELFDSESANPGFAANTRQITTWNPSTKAFGWSGNVMNGGSTGCYYYVYGALSLLDIATEWYYSSTSDTLYLWCSDSATPASHIVETKNRTNAFTLDNLSYVTVNGIFVFGAGISMANTTHCVVNNCNLIYVQHNMTADWNKSVPIANLVSGTGSQWLNSVINYSSQDGIRCEGTNEVVSNCVIYNVDYYPGTYYACVTAFTPQGITTVGCSNTTIINNTLWYSGRYCVGISSTAAHVCSNDMGYGELLTSDGGATYEYSAVPDGTQIHHNWAHNCWAGIYVDGGQNDYVVYNNVCYSNQIGLLLNVDTTNNLFLNNTALLNSEEDIECNGTSQVSNQLVNNLWEVPWVNNSYSASDTEVDNGWYPPVGANFALDSGSPGIHGGEVYAPYDDGYNSGPPDVGAYQNGETWVPGANFNPQAFPLLQDVAAIVTQPSSQTNSASQTANFTVTASGVGPLYYQWQGGAHNSGVFTNLVAGGGQYSNGTNATFFVTNLTLGNAGDYRVVVTNTYGAATSSVAILTVLGLNLAYQAAVMSDNPTSYWPLNEASGTTIHDIVGTNNGTCVNPKGLTLGGAGILSGDNAVYFNALDNSYIDVPYPATLNTPKFTAEAWFNMPIFPVHSPGTAMYPLTFDDASVPNGWMFEIVNHNTNTSPMYGCLASSGWTVVNSGTCLQGQWSYYAMTYDGTTFAVYTNGILAGSQTSGYSQASSGTPLYMGAYNDTSGTDQYYEGGMQNVAVYANALPASRILTHYRAGAFIAPVISVQNSGTNVIVTWNYGYLQEASSVNGPWKYVTNMVSPYTLGVSNSVAALYFQAVLLPGSGQ